MQYEVLIKNLDIEKTENINFFFALYCSQNLPKDMRVPTARDLERIVLMNRKMFKDVYGHSKDILITSEKSSYGKNKYLLENLTSQIKETGNVFSPENPLVISGLELIKDHNSKNEYGFLLKVNETTTFRNDLRYDWRKKLEFGEINYYGPIENEGEGISAIGINGEDTIYANLEKLDESTEDDRLAIIHDIPYEKELILYLEKIERKKKELFNLISKELWAIQKAKKELFK